MTSLEASRMHAKLIRKLRAAGRKARATESRRKRAEIKRRKFHVVRP